MADVRIKCPTCGKLLLADDKYLRYTVSCGCCHSTFVFDSVCIDGNNGAIPVFPPVEKAKSQKTSLDNSDDLIQNIALLDSIKSGKLAKIIFTYALKQHLCDEIEIKNFSDSSYTKKKFHFKYPLFQIFPENNIEKSSLSPKGHNRYYKHPVLIDGKAFFICKEWFDYNRKDLLAWAFSKGITINLIIMLNDEITSSSETILPNFNSQQISQISGDGRRKSNTYVASKEHASFFKVFNKSVFVIGVTIPNDLREAFLAHLSTNELLNGVPHRVSVRIQEEVYEAYILKANQKNGCYFWRLQWSKSAPIALFLQKKYPNIYSALENSPRTIIPSDYGIIVKATENNDCFEIECKSKDITDEYKTILLNENNKTLTYSSNEEYGDIEECNYNNNQNIENAFNFCLDSTPRDFSYSKPLSISIENENIQINAWKELLIRICIYLYEKKKDYILLLIDEKIFKSSPTWCFKETSDGLNAPYQIDDKLWFSTCLSTNQIISLSKEILFFCEYPLNKISISYFIPNYKKRHRNTINRELQEDLSEKEEKEDEVNATSGNASFDEILERWGEANL